MEQFDVPDEMRVKIDYYDRQLPPSVKVLRPLLFKDGSSFCVVLGPNPQTGVFGYGNTPMDALRNWDKHLQERIKDKTDNQVASFIIDILQSKTNSSS